MIVSMKDAVLTVQYDNGSVSGSASASGSITPGTLNVKFKDGNFQWTDAKAYEYVLSRGRLDTVREGDESPCNISFDGMFEYYTGANDLETVLMNPSGDLTGTQTDPCEPYAVTLVLTLTPKCAASKMTYTFIDFRAESCAFDVSAGTISVSGNANILTPTKS